MLFLFNQDLAGSVELESSNGDISLCTSRSPLIGEYRG